MTCGARPGTGEPAASPPEATRRADAGTDRVPAVSQFLEDSYVFDLVADGAQGVGDLLKESGRSAHVRRYGARGRRRRVGARPRRGRAADGPQTETSPLDNLTPRERQAVAQIAEGRSNAGIGSELTVTVAAVERHVTGIFDKLGLHQSPDQHCRILAVLTYLRG